MPVTHTPLAWLETAVKTVRKGGVVALAFERLFGLAANPFDPRALAILTSAKARPETDPEAKPISVIIPSEEALEIVASEVPPLARELANRFWPGPLTILLPARTDLPAPLVSELGLVGVRLPGPCPALDLARECDLILTATSANEAGAADALDHTSLHSLQGVDFVVPGKVPGPPGSTVVDASGELPVVLRQGAVKLGEDARWK